jgi:hypothetical protein
VQICFAHDVRYMVHRDAAVRAIAHSLIANEDVLTHIPKVLHYLYPGLKIDNIELKLSRVLRMSPLREEFKGSFYAQFQSSIEDVIGATGKVTGLDALEKNKRAISSLIMLLIIFGAAYYWLRDSGQDPPPAITGDYNTIFSVVCGNLGCDRGEIERAIDRALSERDRRALLRDAANFAAPAKGGGAVSVDGVGELSSETVLAIPDHEQIDVLEDEEFSQRLEGVEIHVRAMDLDQARRGWAGLITLGEEQRRVRMVIVPGINLENLTAKAHRGPIKADVEVFYRRGRDGEWRPYVMHLYRVYEEGDLEAAGASSDGENDT